MNTCTPDRLALLVQGALAPDEARALERHTDQCQSCREELAWLRAERGWMNDHATRSPAPPPDVWKNVERRVGERTVRQRRVRRVALFTGVAIAAAAVAMVALPKRTPHPAVAVAGSDAGQTAPGDAGGSTGPTGIHSGSSAAILALDDADAQLDDAIGKLQEEYQRRRADLPPARAHRYDQQFAAALAAVEKARESSGGDVAARRRVLHARTRYLRTMQAVVLEEGQK